MASKAYRKASPAILLSFVVLIFSGAVHAKIIYVDDDAPADFDKIQAAIDAAVDGDTIFVNPGTYTGDGNRDIDFLGKAITVKSLNGPKTCIINCEGTESDAHRGFYFHSGEGYDSVLSGLTIINGYAPKKQIGQYIRMLGGAIFCDYSSPVITNCIFRENISGWKGGAIMSSGSKPEIINCLFQNNVAQWGGGLHTSAVYGSDQGPIMTNCTFVDNVANNPYGGGGVYCGSTGKTTLTNCILWGNTSQGGGVYEAQVNLPNPVINYCCIEGSFGSDPLLAQDGYHLLAGSPCIDAGDPDYIAGPDETDLDGNPRITGGRIDMGACEYQLLILYVDDNAAGKNDGSSWSDAFNYLQDALNIAWRGDEIRVAQGIYKPDQGAGIIPGDREATFQLVNGVALKGGYAGAGAPDPDTRDIELYETTLSGDLGSNDVEVTDAAELLYEETREENSFHVVDGSGTEPTAILDGFFVVGGQAWSEEFQYINEYCYGGGLYIMSGSPTVLNCRFIANTALSYGGGVHMDGNSVPLLVNCRFNGNSATDGGGLNSDYSSPILTECTFSRNAACSYNADGGFGGGMYNFYSDSTLTGCTFSGNYSDRWGGAGGMSNKNSGVIVTNCTFTNNSSGTGGGGMLNNRGILMLTKCKFFSNSARDGAGMCNYEINKLTLDNCVFIGNSAEEEGGGMYNRRTSPTLTNCTFSENSADNSGGGMYNGGSSGPRITNCIFWGDVPEEINIDSGTIDVTYNDIRGGWTGEGNIDVDPCFVEPGYWDANGLWVEGDYHLLPDSPCIDTGDPDYIAEPNETDLDDKPRVIGPRIDMGAYESPLPAEVRIAPRTINLASKGNWITCYIWLPQEYDVADIESNTVLLNGQIKAETVSIDERQQVAVARFSREDVQAILQVGEVEITITGQLTDENIFEGIETIKVTNKALKK